MNEEKQIYEQGKESFPAWWIILENLGFLLNWGLGFIILLPFRFKGLPAASLIYLAVLLTFQILLKKHNCTSCYYYGKWCHLGWGKFTSWFFTKDSGKPDLGMKLAISYILQLPVLLIAGLIAGFLYEFTIQYIILLAIFAVLNISQALLRKPSCKRCKARFGCKGSAAP
ncbi:hypothetical protein KAR04_04845 [Candidatus Calescamantes bacterium]|nr:hypothetical protein [Candidatus Calescamantes bacterium]